MSGEDDHGWLKQGSTASGEVAKSYDDWAATYDETLADCRLWYRPDRRRA
jgi:hypothetical protein